MPNRLACAVVLLRKIHSYSRKWCQACCKVYTFDHLHSLLRLNPSALQSIPSTMEEPQAQASIPSDESPVQKQARLRRERREVKIKAGGSTRLDKITQLSGRSAEEGLRTIHFLTALFTPMAVVKASADSCHSPTSTAHCTELFRPRSRRSRHIHPRIFHSTKHAQSSSYRSKYPSVIAQCSFSARCAIRTRPAAGGRPR